jgi:cytidine deaminase
MDRTELTNEDRELLQDVIDASDRLYLKDVHEVAAAVRTQTGLTFSAIHIESWLGWPAVCGEVAALCCMVAAGHRDVEAVAAVWRNPGGEHFLLSPCGRCREMIFDFNRDAWVIVGSLELPYKVRVSQLLPLRTWDE